MISYPFKKLGESSTSRLPKDRVRIWYHNRSERNRIIKSLKEFKVSYRTGYDSFSGVKYLNIHVDTFRLIKLYYDSGGYSDIELGEFLAATGA